MKKNSDIALGRSRKPAVDPPPLYRQLEQELRAKVVSGLWGAGTMIPGRLRLSEEYNVHIQTVERAIKSLISDGILETQGTRGTFVTRQLSQDNSAQTTTSAKAAPSTSTRDFGDIDFESNWTMRLPRTALVGVLTTDNPLNLNTEIILKNLEKSLSTSNATTIYCDRNQEEGVVVPLSQAAKSLIDKRCEVVVILAHSYSVSLAEEAIEVLSEAGVPVVIVSASRMEAVHWNVYYDSSDAGYIATQHLIEHGCMSYLYVATEDAFWVQERLAGMRVALKKARIPEKDLRVACVYHEAKNESPAEAGYTATLAALREQVPHAILASNDEIACGAIEAIRELNIAAGVQSLLVGFDDLPVARQLDITSMRPPLEEMGQTAAQLAVRALMGDPTIRQICLSSHLISRMSSNGTF